MALYIKLLPSLYSNLNKGKTSRKKVLTSLLFLSNVLIKSEVSPLSNSTSNSEISKQFFGPSISRVSKRDKDQGDNDFLFLAYIDQDAARPS